MYYILIKKSDRDVKSLYQYYTEPEQIEITDDIVSNIRYISKSFKTTA